MFKSAFNVDKQIFSTRFNVFCCIIFVGFDFMASHTETTMPNRTLRTTKDGALSLLVRDDWWFYLDLNGEPLYLIGNVCDTCPAIFDRVRNADLPIAPSTLSAMLRKGLDSVSKDLVRTIRPVLPRGTYMAALVETLPTYVERAERVSSMEPHADYYWWQNLHYPQHEYAYELLLPCVAEQSLDPQRVAWYRNAIERGERPTALALSMLDHRYPSARHSEWALAHFLLDGHHKVMAASQLGVPITLLSFFRKNLSSHRLRDDSLVYEHYETHARR